MHRVDGDEFRLLFERAPIGVAFLSLDGVLTAVNPAAARLVGRTAAELVGGPGLGPVHTDDRKRVATAIQQLVDGVVEDVRLEQRLVQPDGTVKQVETLTQVVREPDGTPLYLQSLVVDATERHQAAVVASSSDAIVGRTLDGTITSWNAGAERMYGYTAAEAIGRELSALVPQTRRDERRALAARLQAGERLENYETQRVRKDGTTIDVSFSMSPIRDALGNLVGSSMVARDITESKRALDELQALEARNSAILEAALDCIITMDEGGRIVEFNPAAERTFGHRRDDVVGQVMADLIIPPGLRERHEQGLARYLATGEGPILGQRLELTAIRSDGAEFPVELAVTRVDVPGPPLFTAYLRDVTEQKRTLSELAGSQQLLQAMLDNSPALITITDVDGRYLFMNRSLADAFGIDRDAIDGLRATDLWPAQAAALSRAHDLEVIRTGQPLEYESVAARPDGDRTYSTVKFPVFDARGNVYAAASIATDITESRAAAAAQQALGERLRQSERLESLGQLAGGIAHDFNNLLGVILNYAAFVAEAIVDDPVASRDVEQIRSAAERAARLTRQLLIFGRRDPSRTEVLELDAIVDDIHDLLSHTIGEHIELVVRTTNGLPTIQADRGQVEQVLLNLAVNARDAMPHGGTLTIATAVVDVDDDYVQLHPDATAGPHVELSVSDTGVGMPPEVSAHAFEPFFTTKPKGQGTGLGLATVYGIVTEAGGSASVYSEPGLGTRFRVLFPARDAPAVPGPTPVEEELDGHGETILIVEDEPAIMETTARILRRHGYTVIEAPTAAEAIAAASSQTLHLLLTDSVMPQMSGREVAERIGAFLPDLPILFMSGYSEGAVGAHGIGGEGVPLLEKPFTTAALLQRVRACLAAGR
jgi:PAS domain S-box-containing protein